MRNFSADFATTDFEATIGKIEAATGLKLMKRNPQDPSEVLHGYVSFSEKLITVSVYQTADVAALARFRAVSDYRHGSDVSDAKIKEALKAL
ncbi:MAG: hypothetical protein FJY37_18550 [Betaproteobacteria bacterium]|nr:hypothetical protein [Betaproteobacteria bacterium]